MSYDWVPFELVASTVTCRELSPMVLAMAATHRTSQPAAQLHYTAMVGMDSLVHPSLITTLCDNAGCVLAPAVGGQADVHVQLH